jgi:hypothetical protein
VVARWLVDLEQRPERAGIGGVTFRDVDGREDGAAVFAAVVDEQALVGREVGVRKPRSPPLVTRSPRSRNTLSSPSSSTWIRPVCSTTKRRGSSGGAVTSTGDDRPVATSVSSTATSSILASGVGVAVGVGVGDGGAGVAAVV